MKCILFLPQTSQNWVLTRKSMGFLCVNCEGEARRLLALLIHKAAHDLEMKKLVDCKIDQFNCVIWLKLLTVAFGGVDGSNQHPFDFFRKGKKLRVIIFD